ncbi:MAG: acyltransferase [Bacillota bacterium]
MELTKRQISITKGVAILFMVLLHLFCTYDYEDLYTPLVMIGEMPLAYYLALFGDCCVAIYCFCSGYGLMYSYNNKERSVYIKSNIKRIKCLYINFWIIVAIFVVGLGLLYNNFEFTFAELTTFILNITAVKVSYNGAWWFLTTYIIMVLASPIIFKIIKKLPLPITAILCAIVYVLGYLQRFKGYFVFENQLIANIVSQCGLIGTSLPVFIVGAVFIDKQIYSKFILVFNRIKFKNCVGVAIIICMIVAHGFVQTVFVAPVTGIVFIVIFNSMRKSKFVENVLLFFSKHSTNIWLTHMFFYSTYFRNIVFAPKYAVLIFAWLILLCVLISIVINKINCLVLKALKVGGDE